MTKEKKKKDEEVAKEKGRKRKRRKKWSRKRLWEDYNKGRYVGYRLKQYLSVIDYY